MIQGGDPTGIGKGVFGMVVGGLPTLSTMEKVPVDDDDKPMEEIKIIDVEIYVNPYSELDEEEEEKAKTVEKEDEQKDQVGSWYSNPGTGATEGQTAGDGVGKYLKARNVKAQSATAVYDELPSVPATKKRKASFPTQEFKDFSGW